MSTHIPSEEAIVAAAKRGERVPNILLIGPHGTGKSACIRSLATRHDLSVVIFNCATMDPYTDLIGVPLPYEWTDNDGVRQRTLEMVAPDAIHKADVVFFDELNRGVQETHNGILEILNERSLNGRPLTNLKLCAGAMNPPGDDNGYHVQELDHALEDRFLVKVMVEAEPSIDVMVEHDGLTKAVARALVKWWKEADHKRRDTYISPRRLAGIGQLWQLAQDRQLLESAMPVGVTCDTGKLCLMLTEAVGGKVETAKGDAKLTGTKPEPAAPSRKGKPSWLRPPHGSEAKRMDWASRHSVADLVEQMQSWSQPSQSRFRMNLTKLVKTVDEAQAIKWMPVIEAINTLTTKGKITIPIQP